ncbi:MAG: N-acetylneuraminate synthase family protein [Nitrospirota bacterium]|nr:N-acetylneuraminate synthase family protein [Nitrospirota bacterium]
MPHTWLDTNQPGAPCTIIAEVGQNHDGSLGLAHAFIDAIAEAGADAVKFQTHIASAESTPQEPWRKQFSLQDATRFDYWRRMEFSPVQWKGLKDHASQQGLHFLSSPFSLEAIDLLTQVGVSAWKVPSGEITNTPLLDGMVTSGLPILLSTGLSPIEEIDRTVAYLRSFPNPMAILQCTSMYPCPPEYIGLNVLTDFRNRYQCAVGLSDHSGTIFPGLAAAAIGLDVLEIHVTLSREMFGPDIPSSVTTSELRELVRGIRMIEHIQRNPVNKAVVPEEIAPLRNIFMKSIVAKQDLAQGTILEGKHLAFKKPGTGISPQRVPEVLGQRLRRSLQQDQPIAFEDLEQGQP